MDLFRGLGKQRHGLRSVFRIGTFGSTHILPGAVEVQPVLPRHLRPRVFRQRNRGGLGFLGPGGGKQCHRAAVLAVICQ